MTAETGDWWGPLRPWHLPEAIERPARAAGIEFEDEQADEVYTLVGRSDNADRALLRFVAEEFGVVVRRRVPRPDLSPSSTSSNSSGLPGGFLASAKPGERRS